MKIARAREKECLGVGVVGLMHEACIEEEDNHTRKKLGGPRVKRISWTTAGPASYAVLLGLLWAE